MNRFFCIVFYTWLISFGHGAVAAISPGIRSENFQEKEKLSLDVRLAYSGLDLHWSMVGVEIGKRVILPKQTKNLFVEVLPKKRVDGSMLLQFTIGRFIGKGNQKIIEASPQMIVMNRKLSAIQIQETIGRSIYLSTMAKF